MCLGSPFNYRAAINCKYIKGSEAVYNLNRAIPMVQIIGLSQCLGIGGIAKIFNHTFSPGVKLEREVLESVHKEV